MGPKCDQGLKKKGRPVQKRLGETSNSCHALRERCEFLFRALPNLGLSENFLFPLPGRLIQPLRACGYSSPNIRATLSRHTVTNATHEAVPNPIKRQAAAQMHFPHL